MGKTKPDLTELLVLGGGGIAVGLLAFAFVAPLLVVAVPVAAALLSLPRFRWPAALGVLLLSMAAAAAALWRTGMAPADAARAYLELQRATGEALLAHGVPTGGLLLALLPGYLLAVWPFALLGGLPLGAALALLLSHSSRSARHVGRMPLLVRDAHALAEEKHRPVVWAIPNVLGRGVLTLLSAPPKAGKSWVVWAAVKAMQEQPAGTWFGLSVQSQRVLWLTEEGRSFGDTARTFGIGPGLVEALRRDEVLGWTWADLLHEVRKRAWKRGCALVIIDTLGSWCPQAEQTPEHVSDLLGAVRRELTEPGLGVLLLHHDRKSGGEFGAGVRGSSALVGAVDVLVELRRVPGNDAARRIITTGRYEPLDATAVLRKGRYVLPRAPKAELPAHLTAVLEAVRAAGTVGVLASDLQHSLGLSRTRAYAQLAGLEQRARIRRVGTGTKGDPHRFVAADATPPTPPLEPAEYAEYLNTAAWRKHAAAILVRAGGTCERCREDAAACVHHLTYSNIGNEADDELVALCAACHATVHAGGGHASVLPVPALVDDALPTGAAPSAAAPRATSPVRPPAAVPAVEATL